MSVSKRPASGFTLIEVLIIAPIVILMIGTFVGIMMTMVSDALVTRGQNLAAYNTQSALDTIEQDTFLSTQFLVSTDSLPSPQGSDADFSGTAAFTSNNSLILNAFATDKNPSDTDRQLVYYADQPNACGTNENANRIMMTKVIYFVRDGSLWRRVIVPDWNQNSSHDVNTVCEAPWQRGSCLPDVVSSHPSQCQTSDTRLVDNVTGFSVAYYDSPSATTALDKNDADSAATIEVTITTKSKAVGRDVTYSASLRATKFNSPASAEAATAPKPDKPSVTSTLIGPNTVNFSWNSISDATSYSVSYQINGGAWQDAAIGALDTNYTVQADRTDVIQIRVAAINTGGASDYGYSSRTLPAWTTCDLQNGWQNYGNGYADASFTKTSAGFVSLRGSIKSGSTASNTLICTLPSGFRPNHRLIFATSTNSGAARIDVDTDGSVYFVYGSSTWTTLDDIAFLSSSVSGGWVGLSLQNGWQNYGGDYAPLQTKQDSLDRVYLQGLVSPGTSTISQLPTGDNPGEMVHLPASSGTFNAITLSYGGYIASSGSFSGSYLSTQSITYPISHSGWSDLSLQNGWSWYGSGYSSPQYIKASDNVVMVKGLIKGGTKSNGTIVTTLPTGYRPSSKLVFTIYRYGGWARVDIEPSGNIRISSNTASVAWISLSSIHFIADQ